MFSYGSTEVLAISNGKEFGSGISSMSSWDGEVDPAIRRHGEPHVVRVGVDSRLSPRVSHEIFLILSVLYLRKDLDVVIGTIVTIPKMNPSKNEDLLST